MTDIPNRVEGKSICDVGKIQTVILSGDNHCKSGLVGCRCGQWPLASGSNQAGNAQRAPVRLDALQTGGQAFGFYCDTLTLPKKHSRALGLLEVAKVAKCGQLRWRLKE
ncbi:GD10622 [Drosophila simulans]|uniref:GD10622 n=1 Tax=Drosophila simulans TaxID=7240 RepID=B4QGQ3_DROSI|nr:GD10622 [Drosophila simulans]